MTLSAQSLLRRTLPLFLLCAGLTACSDTDGTATGPDGIQALRWIELDGTERDFDSLKGKVVFLNVWATWCPPCRAEMPSIAALRTRFAADEEVAFLILATDGRKAVQAYAAESGLDLPFQVLVGNLPEALTSPSIPTTYILGPDGAIAEKHVGMKDWNTEAVQATLEALKPGKG